jgi:peptidylprolyl isomerase
VKSKIILAAMIAACCCAWSAAPNSSAPSPQDVLARSVPSDWRELDPENILYMELGSGRVVMQLAPTFAPLHVRAIKTLVRQHYFDGLNIVRAQDNYVVQWGMVDPLLWHAGRRP